MEHKSSDKLPNTTGASQSPPVSICNRDWAECLCRNHTQQVVVCRAYDTHIGMFGFEDMEHHRLFVEVEQMNVLYNDCASGTFAEITLDAVVYLALFRFRVMVTDKCGTSGIKYYAGTFGS